MFKPFFFVQLIAVIALAGCSIWLGQVWRLEATEYQAEKERQGGIQKQRLISEGEKEKNEIIAEDEAEAAQMKGLIDGRAIRETKILEEMGETRKVDRLNAATRAQAYAMETYQGLNTASNRFFAEAATGGPKARIYETIALYLRRASINQGKQRADAWGSGPARDSCVAAQRAATITAKELTERIEGSPNRGFQPVP
jgi:hypothetical protein